MDKKIILYTTNCPQCNVLKAKLDESNISYQAVTDVDLMIKEGFKVAPVLEVDGKRYRFIEAIKWIKENDT